MTRILTAAGFAGAVVGGYVLGRRDGDVRVAVARALHRTDGRKTTELSLSVTRKPSYDTEFDHVAEQEHAERHRIAEEIKGHPLHERRARARGDKQTDEDVAAFTARPVTRERDDIVGPRPY